MTTGINTQPTIGADDRTSTTDHHTHVRAVIQTRAVTCPFAVGRQSVLRSQYLFQKNPSQRSLCYLDDWLLSQNPIWLSVPSTSFTLLTGWVGTLLKIGSMQYTVYKYSLGGFSSRMNVKDSLLIALSKTPHSSNETTFKPIRSYRDSITCWKSPNYVAGNFLRQVQCRIQISRLQSQSS